MCYYFNDIIETEDFDFDNILLDEISCENILIYDLLYKNLIDTKLLPVMFNKVDGFIRDYMMKLNILYCLPLKNMMPFMIGLDILSD